MNTRAKQLIAAILLVAVGLFPTVSKAAERAMTTVTSDSAGVSIELNEGRFLRLTQSAASVFIANPEVADINVKTSRLVYVFGKKAGKTTLYALDRSDNVLVSVDINVSHNIERLQGMIDKLFPTNNIEVESIEGAIVLTGTVATAMESENARRLAARFIAPEDEVINQIAITSPHQVNLRVRVAEVSKETLNRFGFNWDIFLDGNFSIGLSTLNPIFESNSFLTSSYSNGDLDVNSLIDALAEDGLITILAEPNPTALSGETASFLAGGEFPIPIAESDDKITVEFKSFGVSLSFTPTLIQGDRINLHVRPEVSQLSEANSIELDFIRIPGLTVRRAETTVELASGQSFAVAGLLLDDTQEQIKSIPGIGDIPILGALFKSERFERKETELVIIVTPYLVRPVPHNNLPTPLDNYHRPNLNAASMPAQTGTTAGTTIPLDEATASTSSTKGTNAGFILD